MSPWVDRGVGPDAIGLIQQAMDESRLLEFDYVDRMGQPSRRMVEPYRLLLKGMRWYLDGYCLEREGFRLFKLTRMAGLSLTGDCFTPREYRPGATVKPRFQDREVITVELFLLEKARDRFLDVFGASHIGEPCEDGFRAAVTLPDGPLGYQMLFGLRDRLQVSGAGVVSERICGIYSGAGCVLLRRKMNLLRFCHNFIKCSNLLHY